ncbi:hypothetical protein ESB00_02220 [Oleiharenicola lentus]|uniref:DUF4136 domain-containing protein n=1 Tax=Oleiharenicola lentus TaxID=2508720 RepID=A0A4Q1C7K4_9BACT|nr:hypothetical protein [Oleiharenicola lentus]RXK54732.1 hypothetical protein ESB00_02220 [Oleiharenicola lentus]
MRYSRLTISGGLLLAAIFTGCTTVHDVTIDAISDRNKPLGASYHLEVNDPTGGVEPALQNTAVEAIRDALAARGLYEVPARTKPDMVIEASYGIGHGYVKIVTQRNSDIMLGAGLLPPPDSKAVVVYDKTIEITGRAVPDAAGKEGAELWSVKTKITDTKQQLAPYLDALASACIDYIGENPGRELTLPVDTKNARLLLDQRPPTQAAN